MKTAHTGGFLKSLLQYVWGPLHGQPQTSDGTEKRSGATQVVLRRKNSSSVRRLRFVCTESESWERGTTQSFCLHGLSSSPQHNSFSGKKLLSALHLKSNYIITTRPILQGQSHTMGFITESSTRPSCAPSSWWRRADKAWRGWFVWRTPGTPDARVNQICARTLINVVPACMLVRKKSN